VNGSIKLSEKYGVNPSVNVCFYCNEDKNEIVLPGRLKGDAEAPHRGVWNMEPCDKCKTHMEQGIILISVDELRSMDRENPWRTGGWCVVREDAILQIINPPELAERVRQTRVAFVPDDAWDALGLPRPSTTGER
jgi:hypothetical protein